MITFNVRPVQEKLGVFTKHAGRTIAIDYFNTWDDVKENKEKLLSRAESLIAASKLAQDCLNDIGSEWK